MMQPLNTIVMGGCLTHWPLLRTEAADQKLTFEEYRAVTEIHTFGEMFQMIDILRGRVSVPAEIRKLAHLSPRLTAVPGAKDFANLDVVLLEPASPVELVFRGYAVNRFAITRLIDRHLDKSTKDANKALMSWVRTGLIGLNESARATLADNLAAYVQGDSGNSDLARAVVLETRSYMSDLADGFRTMRQIFHCPIGVALYVFRYMPDGRAISWPSGFREQVLTAASAQHLPVFDPGPLVFQHGVTPAMREGLSHYSDEFLPVIGEALVEFLQSIHPVA